MKKFFFNLKKYFKYAKRAAKAELKSEVSDSYLNWLWWIIEPFCFMIIYTFIFTVIFKNSEPYFASFVFVGLTAWDFFSRMVNGSVKLIINNRDLVTKVYIPKYILLISKSFTYLFKMFISFLITFTLMAYQKVPISVNVLYVLLIVFILYILCFGIGTILMHFGVQFNDLANLTNIALKMIFYLSGIFYNLRLRLGGKIGFILLRANPIAFLMDELRKVMLECKAPSIEGLLFWLVVGIILSVIGIRTIHKNENSYAKVI